MKTQHIILFVTGLLLSNLMSAQIKTSDSTLVKSDNLLDMQANLLTSVFGENLDGNATGKSTGYLEILNKSDLSAEQKAEYKNLYYLQAKDLTEKQKDSLGKAIEVKIREAQNRDD